MQAEHRSTFFEYPHYAFERPPELDGGGARHAVAVVGAGPVGLTVALALSRFGVPAVVLDGKDSVAEGSRAICISRRSLEILQQLDAVEAIAAKGLGWTHGSSFYRDRLVYRLEMPHSEDERFHPMTNIQQQYVEKFLVDRAEAHEEIDLRWQSEVEGIETGEDGVVLHVRTPAGAYRLEAEHVVACDGARSTIRRLLGLRMHGDAYEGRYLIADIHMRMDHPAERRAFFDPPANPGSTVLIHKQPDDIWRVDYQLREDDDAEAELAEERVRERIRRILEMIGEHGPWELEWYSLYKAYTLALDDYRHGRVWFAGDAAHLVPIFGVRGLNSGIADADNLGWKLAYYLRGWAGASLLETYSPERRAATLESFANAAKSTRFMTPPSAGYRIMRRAALELAVEHAFTRPLVNPRQSTPYDYTDSALTGYPERDRAFAAGPRAGAPLCNVRLGPDDYLLDHLGAGFNGLYFSESGAVDDHVEELFEALSSVHGPFRPLVVARAGGGGRVIGDPDGRVFERYGAVDGSFYLARPDGHVCARWRQIAASEVLRAREIALGGGA